MDRFYTYPKLIQNLKDKDVLKTPRIIQAFRNIDRKDFVKEENMDEAYYDIPLHIGHNQTISQPTTVAFMLELLKPGKGDEILDVGSGSGWTTALLAEIVGNNGYVYGLEIVPELVEYGRKNLAKYNFDNAKISKAEEDKIGIPGDTFDRILVSAAGKDLPDELVQQLKIGGILVMPVKGSIHKIIRHTKDAITQDEYSGFAFVPLK